MSVHPIETIARLRELRRAGASYEAIAGDLGLPSRSTVAGLVARHCRDIPRPSSQPVVISDAAAPAPTKVKVVKVTPSAIPPTPRPVPVLTIVQRTNMTEILSRPVHVTEARGCRWPLWGDDASYEEKTFCGGVCTPGQSFCDGHRRLAYTAREARRAA